jgi:multidrug efflux pump subunit AcrA (membrane-fusion protein)
MKKISIKNKWMKRTGIVVLISGLVYGGYAFSAKDQVTVVDDTAVQEYTLTKQSIRETLSTSGVVKSKSTEQLLGDVLSEVTAIHVAIGDSVEAGQVLAEMNPIDVESAILNQEVVIANLKQDMKNLGADKGTSKKTAYENAKTSLENAETSFSNNQVLFNSGGISQSELDKALESLNTAKINYENAKAAFDAYDYAAEYSILEKRLQVENTKLQSLQQDLLDHQVVAAIDGVITALSIEEGEVPKTSSVMMEIQDLSHLKIEASISEYDINKIEVGQAVEITTLGNENKIYNGLVENIYPSGQVEGSEVYVTVIIDVTDEDAQLKPNFSANIEILVANKEDALLVPYDALIKTPKGYAVSVKSQDAETPTMIRVETGIESDLNIEIISDQLQEGMIVLVDAGVDLSTVQKQNMVMLPGMGGQGGPGKGGNKPAGVVGQ